MPNLNITQITSFIELANSLNYTKTAEKLHTSQPNLSKIINKIESELGVSLFDRDTRTVSLTLAGETFKKEMTDLIKNYNDAITIINNLQPASTSTIQIAVLGSSLMHLLPAILQEYQVMHPDIKIQLVDYDLNNIQDSIDNPENDILFIPDHLIDDYSIKNYIRIYSEPMCLVSSKYEKYGSVDTEISIYDIHERSLILPSEKYMPLDYKLINDILNISNKNYDRVHDVNSLNSLILMVKSGMGISFLANHMELYYDDLTFTKLKEFQNYFRISCAWREESNPLVKDFIIFLKSNYSEMNLPI